MVECVEILCPGDVIEYYTVPFVVGNPDGLRRAMICPILPGEEYVMTASKSSDISKLDSLVKRIQWFVNGKLANTHGSFRPIHRYFPEKGGELDALKNVLEEESAWGKGVLQRATDNAVANLEEDGCLFAKHLFPVF